MEGRKIVGFVQTPTVKEKMATGASIDDCILNLEEYQKLMREVTEYFTTYKPPSYGYRPTLPSGCRFGKTPLPRGKVAESDDEDEDG